MGRTSGQIEEMESEGKICNSLRWCYPGQVQRVSSQAQMPPLQKNTATAFLGESKTKVNSLLFTDRNLENLQISSLLRLDFEEDRAITKLISGNQPTGSIGVFCGFW